MIDNEALKYFIHEEIFLIKENATFRQETSETTITEKTNDAIVEHSKAQENQKKHYDLVVLLEETQTPADEEMLGKLIPAIGKKYSETKFILSEDWDSISYNYLIVFGEFNIEGLPQIAINEPRERNGTSVIRTFSMNKLHTDRQTKGQFWLGLKKMFKIS
ncbi:MAG: hypothetical protein RIA69_17115 [Cyclobacteriaceae bacterium]